jgi:hypothetical protein
MVNENSTQEFMYTAIISIRGHSIKLADNNNMMKNGARAYKETMTLLIQKTGTLNPRNRQN